MPVVVVGSERNFAALRPRLLEESVTTRESREVRDAIKEANPHANLDKLEPGTVLTVPEHPSVSVDRVSVDEGTRETISGLPEVATQAIQRLAAAGKSREAARKREAKALEKALADKNVAAAAKKDKRLAADLASARKAAEEEDARAKERAATLKQAQAEWTSGLETLRSLLERK